MLCHLGSSALPPNETRGAARWRGEIVRRVLTRYFKPDLLSYLEKSESRSRRSIIFRNIRHYYPESSDSKVDGTNLPEAIFDLHIWEGGDLCSAAILGIESHSIKSGNKVWEMDIVPTSIKKSSATIGLPGTDVIFKGMRIRRFMVRNRSECNGQIDSKHSEEWMDSERGEKDTEFRPRRVKICDISKEKEAEILSAILAATRGRISYHIVSSLKVLYIWILPIIIAIAAVVSWFK